MCRFLDAVHDLFPTELQVVLYGQSLISSREDLRSQMLASMDKGKITSQLMQLQRSGSRVDLGVNTIFMSKKPRNIVIRMQGPSIEFFLVPGKVEYLHKYSFNRSIRET